MTQANVLAQLGAQSGPTFRNRIINGAMVIDQRNAGASVTPTDNQFLVDRWKAKLTQASKYSAQQNAGSVTPPVGFNNYLGFTSLSAYSVTSTDRFDTVQGIEGFNFADCNWGTANAKTVTLSFWVYSSLTGTFGGAVGNGAGNRSYPFSYTISSANTWTQASITIAGDTTGTWTGATNGGGLYLYISLGAGSTNSGTAGAWNGNFNTSATGATSVVGTSGATFYITGVQLEVGSSATGFEYVNYQTSLANCQRYCVLLASGIAEWIVSGQYFGVGDGGGALRFPTTMRSAPTVTVDAAASFAGTIASGSANAFTAFTPSGYTTNSFLCEFTGNGVGAAGNALIIKTYTSSAKMIASAEL